jgi:hypothetical protein
MAQEKADKAVQERAYKFLSASYPELITDIRRCLEQNMTPDQIEELCRALVPTFREVKDGDKQMRSIYHAACYIQAEGDKRRSALAPPATIKE